MKEFSKWWVEAIIYFRGLFLRHYLLCSLRHSDRGPETLDSHFTEGEDMPGDVFFPAHKPVSRSPLCPPATPCSALSSGAILFSLLSSKNSSQGASFSFAPVLKLPCFGKTWPSILRPKLAALLERGGRRACTLVTAGHPFPFWRPQRLFF